MKYKPGDRVGALMSANSAGVKFLGYGVYQGDQIPDDDFVTMWGQSLKEAGLANPKILLDSGDVVWGCECWLGPEEKIRKIIGDRPVEIVNMRDYRLPAPAPTEGAPK